MSTISGSFLPKQKLNKAVHSIEKVNKELQTLLAQEISKRLQCEGELAKVGNFLQKIAEQYYIERNREALEVEDGQESPIKRVDRLTKYAEMLLEDRDQEMKALKQKVESQNLVQCTAPVAETTKMPIPATNEEQNVVCTGKPVKEGDAVELGEMPQKSDVPVSPAFSSTGHNGDASRESSLLSPQPGPSYSLISDDNDEEDGRSVILLEELTEKQQLNGKRDMGGQAPEPPKSPEKTSVSHGYDWAEVQLGSFACFCTKTFAAFKNLRGHVDYYKKARTLPCPVCGKLFSYQSYLTPHLKQAHKIVRDEVETGPGTIVNGGKQETGSGIHKHKNALKILEHVQVSSTSSDKYTCACGKAYARRDRLSTHIAKEKINKSGLGLHGLKMQADLTTTCTTQLFFVV